MTHNKSSKSDECESLPLYSRGEGSRQLMWDVLCEHVRYILKHINLRGSGTEYDLTRWVSGHPERTKLAKEWTFYNTGIWSADEIARGSDGLMNVLNIRSNTDLSNADAGANTADMSETDELKKHINNSLEDDAQSDADDDSAVQQQLTEVLKQPLHLDTSASDLLMFSITSIVRE